MYSFHLLLETVYSICLLEDLHLLRERLSQLHHALSTSRVHQVQTAEGAHAARLRKEAGTSIELRLLHEVILAHERVELLKWRSQLKSLVSIQLSSILRSDET